MLIQKEYLTRGQYEEARGGNGPAPGTNPPPA